MGCLNFITNKYALIYLLHLPFNYNIIKGIIITRKVILSTKNNSKFITLIC